MTRRGSPYPPSSPMPRSPPLFAAAAESVEQAIVDALWQAVPVAGRDTHVRRALRDVVADLATLLRACAPSL